MNEQQIISYLKEKDIDKIKFAFADIDGVLRGKVIHHKKFTEACKEAMAFAMWFLAGIAAMYVMISTTYRLAYRLSRSALPIDLSTFRTVPWQENIPFFLADFSKADGNDLPACPRSLLKRIAKECEAMGFHPEFAQEFEWFNFIETPQTLQEKSFTNLETLTPGMFGYSILRTSENDDFYYDLFNLLMKFNVPLEGLHTETGPGVYEAAILHDHVIEAADRAVLLKTAVKEIAYKHGIMATFMAKWNENLPGCGGHVHQSLWNKDKSENLFYNAKEQIR